MTTRGWRSVLAAGTVSLALAGCPRQPEADPGEGDPCDTIEDCNPGVTCGALRACVDDYCENTHSIIRPCPGAGEPVPPPSEP